MFSVIGPIINFSQGFCNTFLKFGILLEYSSIDSKPTGANTFLLTDSRYSTGKQTSRPCADKPGYMLDELGMDLVAIQTKLMLENTSDNDPIV